VRGLDHAGANVRINTARGALEARALIVTLPTAQLATLPIHPDLPALREAALALPLGKAEKVHFALAEPEEFPKDGHLFARTDTRSAGSYHLRPFGRGLCSKAISAPNSPQASPPQARRRWRITP
jgi:monoamine oxidase